MVDRGLWDWSEHFDRKFSAGLPEQDMGISGHDLLFLGDLLTHHPEWTTVIELGTSTGVTSLLLGFAMHCRQGHFFTFDDKEVRTHAVRQAWLPNMEFFQLDLLEPRGPHPLVVDLIQAAGPALLICDNGNKPEELIRYAPLVKIGDGVCVHDWRDPDYPSAEISPARCPPEMFVPRVWHAEAWDVAEGLWADFRAWVRIG